MDHCVIHFVWYSSFQPFLPSPCTTEDATVLLQQNFGSLKHFDTVVVSKEFLQSCFDHFEPLVIEKAQKVGLPFKSSTCNCVFLCSTIGKITTMLWT